MFENRIRAQEIIRNLQHEQDDILKFRFLVFNIIIRTFLPSPKANLVTTNAVFCQQFFKIYLLECSFIGLFSNNLSFIY